MMIRTALANRSFYEKEIEEITPDFFSLETELPAINAPALILWGDRDQVLHPPFLKNRMISNANCWLLDVP